MHALSLETLNIATGFVPVDLQTAANNGDWVSLGLYRRLIAVLFKAAGTAGDDPTITIKQASAADGTGAKALNFTRAYIKQGTLTAVTAWTRIDQAAANTYTNDTLAESQAIFAVEIDAADLDLANGFTFVQISVADIGGNAQLGCAFYLLGEPRYAQAALPSALS